MKVCKGFNLTTEEGGVGFFEKTRSKDDIVGMIVVGGLYTYCAMEAPNDTK